MNSLRIAPLSCHPSSQIRERLLCIMTEDKKGRGRELGEASAELKLGTGAVEGREEQM